MPRPYSGHAAYLGLYYGDEFEFPFFGVLMSLVYADNETS